MGKTCSGCAQTKPLSDFYPSPRYRLGVCGLCKECMNAYNREWIEANRERRREHNKAANDRRIARKRAAANV